MKKLIAILLVLNSAAFLDAEEPKVNIAPCSVAISNFVAAMQKEDLFLSRVFNQSNIAVSTNSIVVTAPGIMIIVGESPSITNAILSRTWHSSRAGTRLVVQHLDHKYVESLRLPQVFSPKPYEIYPVHSKKSPIMYRRAERKEIQALLDSFTKQDIIMKADKKEGPNKVLDTYFPKAADGRPKNGQH